MEIAPQKSDRVQTIFIRTCKPHLKLFLSDIKDVFGDHLFVDIGACKFLVCEFCNILSYILLTTFCVENNPSDRRKF